MYNEYNVSVKYTKELTTVIHYDTGLNEYENIDEFYRDMCIRDKVICKLDVAFRLCKYFEEATVKKYRPVLIAIANGLVTDAVKFSNCINDFMRIDAKFRRAIHDIYNSCPEDMSFGEHIIGVLADTIRNAESDYRTFFRGKKEVVICISDGYLYFSIVDKNYSPVLLDKYDCEVLSYAKNWRCEFQYV